MIRAGMARCYFILCCCGLPALAFSAQSPAPSSSKSTKTKPQSSQAPALPGKPAAGKKTEKPSGKSRSGGRQRNPKPLPRGVVQKFAFAMKLFEAGKFNEALVAFDAIHRQYPAHEPTIVQYAKTLYRLERIPESYNLFARINPQYLDPETAYEYGYSFYVQNQFEGALFSFKRVPLDHALYDLASYYAAMSAIRLKKYAEAEELLDKAVVLPDKLARNKSLYQRHVASLRMLQERAELEKNTSEEKKRLSADSAATKTPASQAGAPAPPAPYSHAGFFGVTKLGQLSHNRTDEVATFHGQSEKRYKSDVSAFSFSYGPLVPLSYKIDSRQAAVGAQLDLRVTNVASEGSKVLVKYNETQEIIQTLVQKSPLETTRSGDVGGNIWVEYPLPSGLWLGMDGHLSFTYPNFARGQRYGARGIYAQLAWLKDSPSTWIGTLGTTYDLIVDSETKPFLSSFATDASLSIKLPPSSTITVGGRYSMLESMMPETGVPGPQTSISSFLALKQDFPLTISLSAKGSVERKELYKAKDPEQGGILISTADGDTLAGSVRLTIAPAQWLNVAASYKFSKNYWKIHNKNQTERFEALTPSEESVTDLSAAINFVF